MSQSEETKQARKDALRELRTARKQTIERATLRMKALKRTVDAVKRALTEGGQTVPRLADGAGISTSEAMWVVATLKKYGEVIEGEKDGGYFRYQLAASPAESVTDPLDEG